MHYMFVTPQHFAHTYNLILIVSHFSGWFLFLFLGLCLALNKCYFCSFSRSIVSELMKGNKTALLVSMFPQLTTMPNTK